MTFSILVARSPVAASPLRRFSRASRVTTQRSSTWMPPLSQHQRTRARSTPHQKHRLVPPPPIRILIPLRKLMHRLARVARTRIFVVGSAITIWQSSLCIFLFFLRSISHLHFSFHYEIMTPPFRAWRWVGMHANGFSVFCCFSLVLVLFVRGDRLCRGTYRTRGCRDFSWEIRSC